MGLLLWQCCFHSEHIIIGLISIIYPFCLLVELGTTSANVTDGKARSFQDINSDFPESLNLFEVPAMLPPSLTFQCFFH